MSLKRLLAFLTDIMIIRLIAFLFCILVNYVIAYFTRLDYIYVYNKTMYPLQFSVYGITFRIGMYFIFGELMSIYFLALYTVRHQGLTLGDRKFNIRIDSHKYKGKKFYLLRFLLRELSVMNLFIIISIVASLINMIVKRKTYVVWYDDILGINVKDIYKNDIE